MTGAEAKQISGRSESWLRNHSCHWCGQTLWLALTSRCGAIHEQCDPTKKDFSVAGRSHSPQVTSEVGQDGQ